MFKKNAIIPVLLLLGVAAALPAQTGAKNPFTFFIPVGYELLMLEQQTVHNPAAGVGFILGRQDLPFTEVERRFFGLALYQPLIFTETPAPDMPVLFHEIGLLFDGRLNRHQLLLIFKSASDKPISGGLHTFQLGAGWGYELIRRPHVSLILGLALGVSDFGDMLSVDTSVPVLPLPLIRFNIDTKWFASSFDFLTGPNFDFTVAPKSKIRLTGDMRMDQYRSIDDLICEFILWYRFFDKEHRDMAGIGVGFKNDVKDFDLTKGKTFGLQQRSVFAAIDLSILQIQGGWVFDSNYLVNGERSGSPANGFFLSVQGIIPVINR